MKQDLVCPACGSDMINTQAWSEEGKPEEVIECRSCGWTKTEPLGKQFDESDVETRFE
jgi:Zn ribbon nucleic-acid-binding protein